MKTQTNYHLLMLTLQIQITVVEKEVRMTTLVHDHENAVVAVVVDQTIGVVDPDRAAEGVIINVLLIVEVVQDLDQGVGVMIEGITDVRGQGVEVQEMVDQGNVVEIGIIIGIGIVIIITVIGMVEDMALLIITVVAVMIVIMDHLLETLVQVLDFMVRDHHIGAEEGAKMKALLVYLC